MDETLCVDRARLFAASCAASKDRMKRILREDVFDVGNEKFLMLLLVMETKNENGSISASDRFVRIRNEIDHAFIDRCSRKRRVSATVGREIRPRRSRRCMLPAAL